MQRIGDLMKELGFNEDAPKETAKAFIRHLIDAANVSQIERKMKEVAAAPEQLSFQFEQNVTETKPDSKARKPTG
jgi:hypothetical protein